MKILLSLARECHGGLVYLDALRKCKSDRDIDIFQKIPMSGDYSSALAVVPSPGICGGASAGFCGIASASSFGFRTCFAAIWRASSVVGPGSGTKITSR